MNRLGLTSVGHHVIVYMLKHVLRDHCHEKPYVLKEHIYLAEGPTFQCKLNLSSKTTCLERPYFVVNQSVLKGSFSGDCITFICLLYSGLSLKGHSLERTPLQEGRKFLAASMVKASREPAQPNSPINL